MEQEEVFDVTKGLIKRSSNKPTDSKTVLRILAQFKKLIREENPYLKAAYDEENIFVWYAILSNFSGNDNEYCYEVTENGEKRTVYGEYLFLIVLPDNFPYAPPRFLAKTPNGMYKTNDKCCINIGEYHSSSHRANLGVGGFLMEIVNGFIGWKQMGGGINLNVDLSSVEEKKKCARESRQFNRENFSEVINYINTHYEKPEKTNEAE